MAILWVLCGVSQRSRPVRHARTLHTYMSLFPCVHTDIAIASICTSSWTNQKTKIFLGVITNWALALTQLLFVCIYFPNSLSVSDYGKCMHIKHAIEGIHKTERVTHFKIHYLFQFELFQAHNINIVCYMSHVTYVKNNIQQYKIQKAIQKDYCHLTNLLNKAFLKNNLST